MSSPFFAVRGSRHLNEEEFRSHLALAIRLENVGVLLGAGASKCVGGGTMDDIWSEIKDGHADDITWLIDNHFLLDGQVPNIELLIDHIELACLDAARRQATADAARVTQVRHVLRKAIVRAALLHEDLWLRPSRLLTHKRFGPHIRLLARLIGNRQPGQAAPWVFTTNYDLAVEWAAEALGLYCVNGFTGLHNRTFRPGSFDLGLRNVQTRSEARFGAYNIYLAKLHGSVSWAIESGGGVLEQPSQALKPKIEAFLRSDKPSEWPGFLIFPGAAKFVQTTGFVYGEIIRRFTEFLSKPNTCLIVTGYSFADDHINRLIVSALQNPTLQVVIFLPEVDRFEIYPTLATTGLTLAPNELLRQLLLTQLPQITVRGFGDGAYFESFVADLPEPALIDETSERARSIEQLLKRVTSVPVAAASTTPGITPPPIGDPAHYEHAPADEATAE